MIGLFIILAFSAVFLPGQELRPITEGTVYPPLPKQARLQGTVQLALAVKDGNPTVKVISGHPLFAPASKAAVERWPFEGVADGEYRVNYVYELTEPDYEIVYRKRGDAIDRFFLRLFHLSTTTKDKVCVNSKVSVSAHMEPVDGYPGATVNVRQQLCETAMYEVANLLY